MIWAVHIRRGTSAVVYVDYADAGTARGIALGLVTESDFEDARDETRAEETKGTPPDRWWTAGAWKYPAETMEKE